MTLRRVSLVHLFLIAVVLLAFALAVVSVGHDGGWIDLNPWRQSPGGYVSSEDIYLPGRGFDEAFSAAEAARDDGFDILTQVNDELDRPVELVDVEYVTDFLLDVVALINSLDLAFEEMESIDFLGAWDKEPELYEHLLEGVKQALAELQEISPEHAQQIQEALDEMGLDDPGH